MEKMRRRDRALEEQETIQILTSAEYGILSTVNADGQPYGTPLSFAYINKKIYFHCAKIGHKLRNIQHNPKVCFTVIGKTQPIYDDSFTTYYESAIVFGTAHLVEDKEEKYQALYDLALKYLPEDMDKADRDITGSFSRTAVYGIEIEHMTGKAKRAKM